MSENAALEENMPPVDDEAVITESAEAGTEAPAESATATDDYVETDNEKVQKRINQITAEKYAEQRAKEAEQREKAELQRQLDELKSPKLKTKPIPDSYDDYDGEDYQKDLVEYEVAKRIEEMRQKEQEQAQEAIRYKTIANFQTKEADFRAKAPDYDQKIGLLPQFPDDTINTIMSQDNGVELVYHLASNLDIADEVANLSPAMAGMKLGQISASLTATTKTVKTSAAPAPIEPITTGSSLKKDSEDGVVYS